MLKRQEPIGKQAIQEGSEHFIQASEQVKSNAENAGVSFSTQIQNSGSVLDEGSKGLRDAFLVSGTQFKVTMEASGDIVQKAIVDSAVRWEESLNASSEKLQIVIADSGKQLQNHASQASQQFAKDVEASSEKLDLGISATQKALELLSQALVSSSRKAGEIFEVHLARAGVRLDESAEAASRLLGEAFSGADKQVRESLLRVGQQMEESLAKLIKDYQTLWREPQRIWWLFQKHKRSNCKVGLVYLLSHLLWTISELLRQICSLW